MSVLTQIQWRRGTAAQWTTANPVLASGEVGYETDTNSLKVGDGTTAWTGLGYFSGSGGSVVAYVHTQSSPSATWTMNHNLGYVPNVELRTVGGVVFDGQVTHVTVNQAVANFASALAGTARFL